MRLSGRRIGLALGLLAFVLLLALPTGLQPRAAAAAAITALMAVWWMTEALPIAVTALLPLVLFPLLALSPASAVFSAGVGGNLLAAARPYVDPYIWLFAGGMGIAAAMQQCGLHRRIALAIMARVGTRPARLLLGVLLATAAISAWISNTATATLMLPIGMSVLSQLERQSGRRLAAFGAALMLAVAYGSNVGGIATKIGTAPNAQFAGFMAQRGVEVGFLPYMVVGTGFILLFLPVVWAVLWRHGRKDAPDELPAAELAAERAALGPMAPAERLVLGVFLAAAALWIVGQPLTAALRHHVPFALTSAHVEGTVAILAALLLLAVRTQGAPVLSLSSLRGVPWDTLLLLGGSFSMAAGVQQSGLADDLARSLAGLRELPPLGQLLGATTTTVALSALASNTATIGVMLPVLASAVAPERLTSVLFGATVAASCDFALPAGTPPNAIVFGSGYLTIPLMVRLGLPLDLLAALVAALWCHLVVPLVLP